MTSKPYNTNRAVAALIVAVIFYLLSLWLSWSLMNSHSTPLRTHRPRFNVWALLFPALLIAEIFIYRWLRSKHIIRRYANLHVWSVILRLIVSPLFSALLTVVMITHMGPSEIRSVGLPASKIMLLGADIIFIAGHIFLILVILKRNDQPVQDDAGTAADHLNEFAE